MKNENETSMYEKMEKFEKNIRNVMFLCSKKGSKYTKFNNPVIE
jgi:hypothetical protein